MLLELISSRSTVISFQMQASASGALMIGNAEQIGEKASRSPKRRCGRISPCAMIERSSSRIFPSVPQAQVLESIELLSAGVLPAAERGREG